MDPTEDPQLLEITALQSIYAEDFIECPPPKAWKGAARLHEFIIRVAHPEPDHASKISIHLHVKFPKTYPRLACPTFTIEKPIKGINDTQIMRLSQEVNSEAQRLRGFEMVFTIVTFVQDWMSKNITPVVGSLALQMNQRAMDEERVRRQRELEEAQLEEERARQAAQVLDEQIQADAMRQMLAREQQYKARRRANSEATEVPQILGETETPTETFQDMEMNGVKFNTVKLFHPRTVPLGLVYMAEPVVPDITSVTPLELFVVNIQSPYYTTSQGRKKLAQVEDEIKHLINTRHPKLLSVYAVKLTIPRSSDSGPSLLVVLTEQTPALTLHDVLEDCDSLREDRATDYIGQILAALNAVHLSGLVHRAITPRCIGLVSSKDNPDQPKTIKLCRTSFHTRLLDLHRSNSFGENTPMPATGNVGWDEASLSSSGSGSFPEGWLSRDVQNESSLLYTRQRDIHDVGIVLLQMMLGLDVIERYADPVTAIHSSSISPILANQALVMIQATKKLTVMNLLSDFNDGILHSPLTSKTIPSFLSDPKTPMPFQFGSPEGDYFRVPPPPAKAKQASRWKEDWEELELLGKGAFGSVVKAKNKIDSRIYAVKKVRLRNMQSDKIFREVNALSRLSHRNIVRYYTTWVETSEPDPTTASSDDSSLSDGTEDGMTSVPDSFGGPSDSPRIYHGNGHGQNQTRSPRERNPPPINGGFHINIEELDDTSMSRSSFPSIHFGRSSGSSGDGDSSTSSGSEERDEFSGLFKSKSKSGPSALKTPAKTEPTLTRTLYIQMEFVERQTLRERVDEGILEDEAWRLFQQIVDALVHMSTLGILHRDIKLTNIFIDAKGDCKVGDFGLATSALAAVDPSDVGSAAAGQEPDMTLEVGTRLYIAPEVQFNKRAHRGPRDQSKADMYSLGIVFFEMNFKFNTGVERIVVLEDLRKPPIIFPSGWDPTRTRQKDIITWLLQHDPQKRPTAFELSQSPLLPARMEDEYFKGALRLMAKPDSQYHQTVLTTLFKQPPRPSRVFTYDIEVEQPQYALLNENVKECLEKIFQLRGAMNYEPPLLMPIMDVEEERSQATFIDPHGDVVALPNNILVPFARLAARTSQKRIKRYHITNVFRPSPVAGHPKSQKAALFDIISPDLRWGPLAAGAEIIALASDCLDSFPTLSQHHDIHISHSKIVEIVLNRVPADARSSVIDTIQSPKLTPALKRAALTKKNLLRSTIDEIELLAEVSLDIDETMARLQKVSPSLAAMIETSVQEAKDTLQLAKSAKVAHQVLFHPLMLGTHHTHFKDGVLVEVVRKNKTSDVLAAGGRYDNLISRFLPLKQKLEPKQRFEPLCAYAIQIAVEKIAAALAAYQHVSVHALSGHLQDRLEVASFLWQNNISADLMYETGLPDAEHENHLETCAREGILFTVYPRPRTAKNLPPYKVKSILKGTEVDLSRQQLVGWLQQAIAEQKRVDMSTSGAPLLLAEVAPDMPTTKDTAVDPQVKLVLPDLKKQRKTNKQILSDKAFEKAKAMKNSFQSGISVLAVDVTPAHFDALIKNSNWITDEEAWKVMSAMFPPQHSEYAPQVREAALKRKLEGDAYVLMFNVREERAQILSLS
ncbi:hypothetical protein NLJ89_g752 [Agrocybe chaxingu]|uniref:non-specific serine/threonine protein kinase n=1 Tax=Agrocybe chaxingu TaxID=84603 RepID=A0A9W8N1C3_9AGAR|nr:hypothetical protein NLJ89_g752 [Agrocybe chaxingu]